MHQALALPPVPEEAGEELFDPLYIEARWGNHAELKVLLGNLEARQVAIQTTLNQLEHERMEEIGIALFRP